MRERWRLATLVAAMAMPALADDSISYSHDVRPILAEFCWRCHGSSAADRQSGLRLDERTGATAAAASGKTAIVPGRPEASQLWLRVQSTDPDERMPPPASGRQPSPRQLDVLSRWIAAGAPYEEHWAFTPLRRPPLPVVRQAAGSEHPIDRFIVSRLDHERLPIPAVAPAAVQMRRLSFALRGLPPDPEVVEAFVRSPDPAAWSGAIDGMLGTTAYGEHWARHWMDVVRYADSAGYELDYLFEQSHRYRDWLIRAFRDNLPLDRFLEMQLAADQLAPDDTAAADGLLFLTVGPRRFEGGIQRGRAREYEWLTDVTDTVGAAFLGLTVGCARCHDHKYESLSQRDYFGLQAIFAEAGITERRTGKGGETSPAELRVVVRDPPTTVHVLRRGEIDAPQDEAPPTVPGLLDGDPASAPALAGPQRRAAFARWLTSAARPLTARVLVNRVWQWHFGAGLVRTPNDFGVQGDPPSHPELLDWLAIELVESGWNLAHLQRLILTSRTFRAASAPSAAARDRDPDNRWLSHFPRRRLQAEELRDALLAVSGRLNGKPFGPPVVPSVEPWVLAPLRNQNWVVTEDAAEWSRRAIYLVVRRSVELPFIDAFDGPDVVSSCAVRDTSVAATQALVLLNEETTLEAARGLAARIWSTAATDPAAAVRVAWWLVFGREPTADEVAHATRFLEERRESWEGRTPPEGLTPTAKPAGPATDPLGTALVEWAHALLNTGEFCHVE